MTAVVPQAARRRSSGFVGRDAELDAAAAVVGNAESVLVVEGEAGVGKSRLVAEILSHPRVQGRRVLFGNCQPIPDPFPLGPVVEALRTLRNNPPTAPLDPVVGSLVPLLPELAPFLPDPPVENDDPGVARHQVFRAAIELFAAVAPVVVVVEDLHWADEGTQQFVTYLADHLGPKMSLLVTYRPEDRSPGSRELLSRLARAPRDLRLNLRPLDPADVKRFVGTLLDTDHVSDEFGHYLHAKTGGLPLAIEEMVGLLSDQQDLVQQDGRWVRVTLDQMRVPDGIRDFVLARAEQLSEDARDTLDMMAVIGIPTTEDELTACVDGGDVAAALCECLDRGLLIAIDDSYRFRHDLGRDAVYSGIPQPRRRHLHSRVAEVLVAQKDPPAGRLPRHYREAGCVPEWLRWSEEAAERLMARGGDAEATWFLLDALSAAILDAEDVTRLGVKLAYAALHSLQHDAAVDQLRRLLDDPLLSPAQVGRIRMSLGWLIDQGGRRPDAIECWETAVGELEPLPEMQVRAMASLAGSTSPREALRWSTRALATAEEVSDDAAAAMVRVDHATLLVSLGHPDFWGAIDAIPETWSRPEELRQIIRGCNNVGNNLVQLGHYGPARHILERGLRLSEEHGYGRLSGAMIAADLSRRWLTGDADVLGAAEALLDPHGAPVAMTDVYLLVGLRRLAGGDIDLGRRYLLHCREIAREAEHGLFATASAALATLLLVGGDADMAWQTVQPAVERSEPQNQNWVLLGDAVVAGVQSLTKLGDTGRAARLLADFSDGIAGRDAPAAHSARLHAHATLVSVRDPGTAAECFREAQVAWTALPRPLMAARCIEAQGECISTANSATGKKALWRAEQQFADLGATWDAARVRQTLRRHGVATATGVGRRGYGDALSPRELEVARLVADGKTDREIAKVLFLSPRTASNHVSRILRKLNAHDRAAIGAHLESADMLVE